MQNKGAGINGFVRHKIRFGRLRKIVLFWKCLMLQLNQRWICCALLLIPTCEGFPLRCQYLTTSCTTILNHQTLFLWPHQPLTLYESLYLVLIAYFSCILWQCSFCGAFGQSWFWDQWKYFISVCEVCLCGHCILLINRTGILSNNPCVILWQVKSALLQLQDYLGILPWRNNIHVPILVRVGFMLKL